MIVTIPWYDRDEVIYTDLKVDSTMPNVKRQLYKLFQKFLRIPNVLLRNSPDYNTRIASSQNRSQSVLIPEYENFPGTLKNFLLSNKPYA
ncbi:hypothetical protein NPIL_53381 [Nephila pilipes]|uniref:Uncharacterized protein n=1 Tax=Nephila pilipes TaxID=299642 RepID=A0A8X6NPQ4_NEPPI|nr:hypothetical protein NPIL_53381 [Nephila pilipes]